MYLICNKWAVFFVFLCWGTSTLAQDFKFTHLSTERGLSNANVTCILQDQVGFMWFGTADGLNRFDGYSMKTYRKNAAAKTSLPSDYVSDIAQDHAHNLWVATNSGLAKYNPRLDVFEKVAELDTRKVVALFVDKRGNLWVGGDRTLSVFYHTTQKWEHLSHLFPESDFLGTIAQTQDDDYWIGSNGEGVYHLHWPTRKVSRLVHDPQNPNSLPDNAIHQLCPDREGNLWIATVYRGISKYEIKSHQFTNFRASPGQRNAPLVNSIRDICPYRNTILLATENGGISQYDPTKNMFVNYLNNQDDPASLSDNSVWCIYPDRQDRVWVGTYSKGISVWDKRHSKFSTIGMIMPDKVINAILKDSKGRLWVGTEKGLFLKEQDKVTHFRHDPNQANSLGADPVLRIYEDSKKRIWVGTWQGGANLYEERSGTFRHFIREQPIDGPMYLNCVFAFGETDQGQILIGSSGGLFALNVGQGKTTPFESTMSMRYLRDILVDSQRNLWVGTLEGLHFFGSNGQTAHYISPTNDPTSLSLKSVLCLLEDLQKRIWVGTKDGLNLMLVPGKFRRYTTANGLPNNQITGMVADQKGNMWINTNQGLSKFDPSKHTFTNYDEKDGLLSRQFKANAIQSTTEGNILQGSYNGVNIFHPDSIRANPTIPKVVFTELKVNNRLVQVAAPDSILPQQISQTKQISLTHKQLVFSLDFVALNFTHSEKNQYAYRLDPFDADWNYVGQQRNATYTNLPAGTYILRVKASNNDGVWNEEGTRLQIIISPPWWLTLWFKILVISFLVGGVVSVFLIRTNFLKQQNRNLEQKVSQRTRDLENANEALKQQNEYIRDQSTKLEAANYLKDQLFSIIAHDLRSPLASLQGILTLLQQEGLSHAEFKGIAGELAQGTANASNLLHNLLHWANSQMKGSVIRPERIDLALLAQRQLNLFSRPAKDKDLRLTSQIPAGTIAIADTDMVDLVLRNLVANAVKFCRIGDGIDISTEVSERDVQVKVTDTGIGISPENLALIFQRDVFSTDGTANEKGTGLGLLLCKDFVEKNGGSIGVTSQLGAGSTFYFTLPRSTLSPTVL